MLLYWTLLKKQMLEITFETAQHRKIPTQFSRLKPPKIESEVDFTSEKEDHNLLSLFF